MSVNNCQRTLCNTAEERRPQPNFTAYRNNLTPYIIFLDFNTVHIVINRRHTAVCVTVQVHNSVLVFSFFMRSLCGILDDYKEPLPYLGTLK